MTSRRFAIPAALLFVAMLALPVQGDTQVPRRGSSSPSRPLTPLQAALRAFNEGRYDEATALADKLGAGDPSVVALKARVAIARGKYGEAEGLLQPAADKF